MTVLDRGHLESRPRFSKLLQKCTLLAHHMGHDQKQDVEDGTAVRRPGVSKLRLVSPYRRNLAPGAELGVKTRPSD